jgi:hypothetical protein
MISGVKTSNILDVKEFERPVRVTPRDGAFQGNIRFFNFEWWHFEAVFDNGYSIHVGLILYHLKNSGIARSRLDVYHMGKTEFESTKTHLFSDLHTSSEQPSLKLDNRLTITFDYERYKKNGEWSYHIHAVDNQHAIDLAFTGTTPGWKTKTSYTQWAAILPKAKVTGTITIHGQQIKVNGWGYHDHNWDLSPTIFLKKLEWFCGTIYSDTLKLTWAKALRTLETGELLAVINRDDNHENKKGFYIIPETNVTFLWKNWMPSTHHQIPSEFSLKIQNTITVNDHIPIHVDLQMKTIDTQHMRFFTTHYWICHVTTTGFLTLGATTERLNNSTQIIEFPSLK